MTLIAQDLDQHIAVWPEEARFAVDLTRGRDLELQVLDILDAP